MFSPADFRNRIKFTLPILVENEMAGTEQTGTQVVLEANAKVDPFNGTRDLAANQQALNQAFEIIIWKREGFEPTKSMTIEYGGKKLTINSIITKRDGRWYHAIRAVENGQNY